MHRHAGFLQARKDRRKESGLALRATGVPFILGFARSVPIKWRLSALSPQQRRSLVDGGAVHLGVCPWDERSRLFALGARSPTHNPSPWVYVTNLRSEGPQRLAQTYRQRWRCEQAIEETLNGHDDAGMQPDDVVAVDPGDDCSLGLLAGGEAVAVDELSLERAPEAFGSRVVKAGADAAGGLAEAEALA